MTVDTEVSIDYDDDSRAFTEAADEFVRREVVPNLARWRAASVVPAEVFASAGDTGLLGIFASIEAGGLGVTDLRFGDVSTRALTGAGAFGLAWSAGVHATVAIPALAGTSAVRPSSSMADLASGTAVATVAGLDGTLTLTDDGVLDGISHGVPSSSIADVFVVLAQSESGRQRVVRVHRASSSVDENKRYLGATDANARSVRFDSVSVSPDDMLRDGAAEDLLGRTALLAGALSVSAARFCIDHTVEYVNERQVFGRPVAMFDNTRAALSSIHAGLRAVVQLRDAVLRDGLTTPQGRIDAMSLALHSVEIFGRAADLGVQLHGGYGYMTEYPISHAFAAARFLELTVRGLPTVQEHLARATGLVVTTPGPPRPRS